MKEQLDRNSPAVYKIPVVTVGLRAAADSTELEGRTGCPLSQSDVFFKALTPMGLYFQSGFKEILPSKKNLFHKPLSVTSEWCVSRRRRERKAGSFFQSSALFQRDVVFYHISISLCPHCRLQGRKSADKSLNPTERILTISTARRVLFLQNPNVKRPGIQHSVSIAPHYNYKELAKWKYDLSWAVFGLIKFKWYFVHCFSHASTLLIYFYSVFSVGL